MAPFVQDAAQLVREYLTQEAHPPVLDGGSTRTSENSVMANFREFPFRDCMKKGRRVVFRYSIMHEKALPDGSLR